MGIAQRGSRLLAADAGSLDNFGHAVAVSSDGMVLAVGAPYWDGGVYTDQGAVYIYDYTGGAWVQRGSVLLAGDVSSNDERFGSALALSSDGSVLAVGSTHREVGGNTNQGAVYVYDYTGGAWVQRGSVLSGAAGASYYWGTSVALSDDGSVIAFGSPVVYGVYVYVYSGGAWNFRSVTYPAFGGASVALSGDGSVMAIGAPKIDTAFFDDGGVYIYDWGGSSWTQRGSVLVAPDPADNGYFGKNLAISSDGLVLVVAAYNYAGVSDYRGAIYLFDYTGGAWVQRGDKLLSSDSLVSFYNQAISSDASVLVVGGPTYDGSTTNQGAVYTYDITLDNLVTAPTSLTLEASIGSSSAPTSLTLTDMVGAPTALTLIYPTGSASASTSLTVTSTGYASAPTILALSTNSHVPTWSARCLIDGVDVSDTLKGVATVTADEGAARVATLSIKPPSGVIAPLDYVGKELVFDYVLVIEGIDVPMRLFTGRIDTPSYDLATGLLTLDCVDDLQNRVASLERSVLDGVIGGRYTEAVQGEMDDNWDYAEALLTTVPASLDAGPHGGLRVTPWELADTWFNYDNSALLYQRSVVRYPQRSTLINHVDIVFEYRYPRLRQRYTSLGWSGTHIDMAPCGYQYPTQQDILGACSGSGWVVTGGVFYPAPAAIPHSSGGFIYPPDGSIDMAIIHLTQRHFQTVTESYSLTVSAPESVDANGSIPHALRGALASDFDGSAWESALDVDPLMPAGGEQDYSPDAPRADAEYAIQTLLDQAKVKIIGSHRGARVTNAVLCNPDIDLDKRIEIATAELTASGKVASVSHVLDLFSGSAITEFTLACFGAGGAGIITPDTLDPPAAPDEAAATQAWPDDVPHLYVNTYGITAYSDGLMGLLLDPPESIYVDNIPPGGESASFPNPYYVAGGYPVNGFRVQMPGVDDADRNPIVKPVSGDYSILIPSDPLTLTIP